MPLSCSFFSFIIVIVLFVLSQLILEFICSSAFPGVKTLLYLSCFSLHWIHLTTDCIGCIECRFMLLSLLWRIDCEVVHPFLLIDWRFWYTTIFCIEVGPVEDHHSLYSLFLCCLTLSVFMFCLAALRCFKLSILHHLCCRCMVQKSTFLLSWIQLCLIDILFHFFITSYSHYIPFVFLVPCVLEHKISMTISIFECFVP